MRLAWLVVPAFVFSVVSGVATARVLLPEDYEDTTTPQSTVSPSTPPNNTRKVIDQTPPTVPMRTLEPTQPTASSNLDSVNVDLVDKASIEAIRKSLPAEYQSLTDSDIKNMHKNSFNSAGPDSASNYMDTDPKTGKPVINLEKIQRVTEGVTGKVELRPGGSVPDEPPSDEDLLTAKYLAAGKIPPKDKNKDIKEFVKKKMEEENKKYERPPTFINDIELSSFSGPMFKSTLLIGVMNEYAWDETDVQRIISSFGFKRKDITKNCQLRAKIKLKSTDGKNKYSANMFAGEQKTINFAGDPIALEIRPMAVCNPPATLPQNGQVIIRHGDKYGVVLKKGSCEIPQPKDRRERFVPAGAGVKYLGGSKFSCAFK